MGVQISLHVPAFPFLEHIAKVELLVHMVILVLIFGGIAMLFSLASALFYIPTTRVPISPRPCQHLLFSFFFYHKWLLNFVRSFFCVYWDHMVFILQFVNMVYHIDWFAYIEESLHSWDKPHLIMVYDPFNVLLDCLLVFCWGFLHLCSSEILARSFLFLWHLCLVLVSEWVWECSSLCYILQEFEKDRC